MPSSVFRSVGWPRQISGNLINASAGSMAGACESDLGVHDLVYSIEVAEHIPPHLHEAVAGMLSRHTGRFLVFSAGRPGQGGLGHIGNRAKSDWAAAFARHGLTLLQEATALAAKVCRNREIRKNIQVFAATAAPPELIASLQASTARKNAGALLPRAQTDELQRSKLAWLSGCLSRPPTRARDHNKDACNLTHSVPFMAGRGMSVPRLQRRVSINGQAVAWTVKNFQLRRGEALLWPELVVQQANECSGL